MRSDFISTLEKSVYDYIISLFGGFNTSLLVHSASTPDNELNFVVHGKKYVVTVYMDFAMIDGKRVSFPHCYNDVHIPIVKYIVEDCVERCLCSDTSYEPKVDEYNFL